MIGHMVDMAKDPRSWVQLVIYLAVIFIGGWQVHQRVMDDLDTRIQLAKKESYPFIAGADLKDEVQKDDEKLNKRLDIMEADIKELLRRK